ncbi:TPA: LysR family transcriptional regulator [Citrobacter freundii]|nr:LysR family transcriptional regulator [Citrobacter freundii]
MKNDEFKEHLKKLASFDFSLIEVFELLYAYENATVVAKILNRTPSAISQSLTKLKNHFSDPLFIKGKNGLLKTAMAKNIHEIIGSRYVSMLNDLQELSGSTNRSKINVCCSPYSSIRVMPMITQIIREHNLDCIIIHSLVDQTELNITDELSNYQADFIFDLSPIHEANVINTVLSEEPFYWVCSKNHPRIDDRLTPEMFRTEHFAVYNSKSPLVKEGQNIIRATAGERIVRLKTPSFLTMSAILEQSDLVSIVPVWFYHKFGEIFSLKKLSAQHEPPKGQLHMTVRRSALKNKTIKSIYNEIIARFEQENEKNR